jgi:hypothetical protein
MQVGHQPTITRRADSAWVVHCAQCHADRTTALPVGINMPLGARETAELLCENHSGANSRRVAS